MMKIDVYLINNCEKESHDSDLLVVAHRFSSDRVKVELPISLKYNYCKEVPVNKKFCRTGPAFFYLEFNFDHKNRYRASQEIELIRSRIRN